MKVLVLGGTRYLGLALVNKIQNITTIKKVYTLSKHKNIKNKNYHFILNRKELKALKKIYKKIKPDVVIDMICFSADDSKGILNLNKNGYLDSVKHYIIISSFFVYNHFSLNKFKEKKLNINDLEVPFNDKYTKNKIEMEITLSSSEFFKKTSIIRFPFIFSWDDYTRRFQNLCELATIKKKYQDKENFKFSMISKKSAVEGLIELIKKEPMGIIDLANSGCLTVNEIIDKIISLNIYQSKSRDNHLKKPYDVNKKLCISTKKISVKKILLDQIEEEAKIFFRN